MTEQAGETAAEAIGTAASVDYTGEGSGDSGGRESYHGYSVDDEDQPQSSGDSLVDDRGLANPLDEGFSPGEKWSTGQGYGNTPLEEAMGETLDQRIAQELPEPDPYEEAESMSLDAIERGTAEEGSEVGDERAGRLVEPDEGARADAEPDMVARDAGTDLGGYTAEESAMRLEPEV